jgi:anti-sigma regulatory factor (Ser/Thr protein kinase)
MTRMAFVDGYRHEAVAYRGRADFVATTCDFVRDGLESGDRILVVVRPDEIEALRDELGPAAELVAFSDMSVVGRNPARLIAVWRQFAANPRPGRGVGEPIWSSRPPAELVEAQLHEALLNVALPPNARLWLRCPYDQDSLDPDVLDRMRLHHPYVDGTSGGELESPRDLFGLPLPAAPPDAVRLRGESLPWGELLHAVRDFVYAQASAAGLDEGRTLDLVLAVSEATGNSLRHGSGNPAVAAWAEGDRFICEVRDDGTIDDPLVGRSPDDDREGGWGLWLANQFCDLAQIRSPAQALGGGTQVRLHMIVS